MRFLSKRAWGPLILSVAIGGSAGVAQQAPVSVPPVPAQPEQAPPSDLPAATGPHATSQTGTDAPRYDEVGYASWYGDELRGHRTASGDSFNPDGITAASRTLPMGSFAEVTALDSGRTVLVEITDRGPHRADRLIDLSLGAAKLLGVDQKSIAAVRVRQVDPPAADQVALRQGRPAAPRLDSPPILLAGLKARLGTPPVAAADPVPASTVSKGGPVRASKGTLVAGGKPLGPPPPTHLRPPASATPPATPARDTPTKPATAQTSGHYAVQVAAFSSAANAKSLAGQIDGHVIPAGKFWRVELGPFPDAAAAKHARDGAAKRGYGDAHVIRKD